MLLLMLLLPLTLPMLLLPGGGVVMVNSARSPMVILDRASWKKGKTGGSTPRVISTPDDKRSPDMEGSQKHGELSHGRS